MVLAALERSDRQGETNPKFDSRTYFEQCPLRRVFKFVFRMPQITSTACKSDPSPDVKPPCAKRVLQLTSLSQVDNSQRQQVPDLSAVQSDERLAIFLILYVKGCRVLVCSTLVLVMFMPDGSTNQNK